MNETNQKVFGLRDILRLTIEHELCGVNTKVFKVDSTYGNGSFTSISFDGLTVRFLDTEFNSDMKFQSKQEIDALVFSALVKGEKKICIKDIELEVFQENHEGYISYVQSINGSFTYSKNKPIKEVVVKMTLDFIKKHQLDSLFPIVETYSLQNIQHNFMYQLCNKTQQIIAEIIDDKRNGILKRLFLESKVLELLSLQIDTNKEKEIKGSTTIKKVYKAERILVRNLDTQFSIYDLSRKVFLNEFLLKKEFKRIFNDTIFEYTFKKRMEEAKKLLRNTSKPIYEIAESVGYKNPTHFTAAFKKVEKKTPKIYRKEVL